MFQCYILHKYSVTDHSWAKCFGRVKAWMWFNQSAVMYFPFAWRFLGAGTLLWVIMLIRPDATNLRNRNVHLIRWNLKQIIWLSYWKEISKAGSTESGKELDGVVMTCFTCIYPFRFAQWTPIFFFRSSHFCGFRIFAGQIADRIEFKFCRSTHIVALTRADWITSCFDFFSPPLGNVYSIMHC